MRRPWAAAAAFLAVARGARRAAPLDDVAERKRLLSHLGMSASTKPTHFEDPSCIRSGCLWGNSLDGFCHNCVKAPTCKRLEAIVRRQMRAAGKEVVKMLSYEETFRYLDYDSEAMLGDDPRALVSSGRHLWLPRFSPKESGSLLDRLNVCEVVEEDGDELHRNFDVILGTQVTLPRGQRKLLRRFHMAWGPYWSATPRTSITTTGVLRRNVFTFRLNNALSGTKFNAYTNFAMDAWANPEPRFKGFFNVGSDTVTLFLRDSFSSSVEQHKQLLDWSNSNVPALTAILPMTTADWQALRRKDSLTFVSGKLYPPAMANVAVLAEDDQRDLMVFDKKRKADDVVKYSKRERALASNIREQFVNNFCMVVTCDRRSNPTATAEHVKSRFGAAIQRARTNLHLSGARARKFWSELWTLVIRDTLMHANSARMLTKAQLERQEHGDKFVGITAVCKSGLTTELEAALEGVEKLGASADAASDALADIQAFDRGGALAAAAPHNDESLEDYMADLADIANL